MRGLGKNNQTNNNSQSQQRGHTGSSNQERVDVYQDSSLEGNTVRAEYQLDENGVVKDVYIRAGKDATDVDLEMHQQTAKVMQMYGGTLGKIRKVEAKIAKKLGIKGQPQIGTKAWEAQLEVEKLNRVVEQRMGELSVADGDRAIKLKAEIEYLQEQLDTHSRTFEGMDESDGVGFVAQRGVKRTAEQITNLRQKAPKELQAQLDEPPVGVLSKQEIGKWLWEQENPDTDSKFMPKNLTARANTLIKQWQEQKGSEVYLTSDGKVAFDESIRDSYDTERISKQKKPPRKSVYTDTMYGDAERITLAEGWEFQTGKIISTADAIAERQIDTGKTHLNGLDKLLVVGGKFSRLLNLMPTKP